MNNVRTFPACRADQCAQGRRPCPVPDACRVPEADPNPLPWLSVRWFWIGYLAGMCVTFLLLLGVHFGARF